ncbi:MAG: hypothetical protein AAF649_02610 [Verrucomicrobiota bacterium]
MPISKASSSKAGLAVPTAGVITETDTDILTLSPSTFIGFSHTFDTYAVSTTVSYVYSESYWKTNDNSGAPPAPSSFARSTGNFTWLVAGTHFLTDTLDFSLSHQLTQVAHTNNYLPLGTSNGEHDHNWSTIGLDINWILSQSFNIYGGVDYDLFNRNYKETITGTLGLSCHF